MKCVGSMRPPVPPTSPTDNRQRISGSRSLRYDLCTPAKSTNRTTETDAQIANHGPGHACVRRSPRFTVTGPASNAPATDANTTTQPDPRTRGQRPLIPPSFSRITGSSPTGLTKPVPAFSCVSNLSSWRRDSMEFDDEQENCQIPMFEVARENHVLPQIDLLLKNTASGTCHTSKH